jgi:hypothetical protein
VDDKWKEDGDEKSSLLGASVALENTDGGAYTGKSLVTPNGAKGCGLEAFNVGVIGEDDVKGPWSASDDCLRSRLFAGVVEDCVRQLGEGRERSESGTEGSLGSCIVTVGEVREVKKYGRYRRTIR